MVDQPSRFTAWLRECGYAHLSPLDDRPHPLTSRVAMLVKQNAPQADIKLLQSLWAEWKAVSG